MRKDSSMLGPKRLELPIEPSQALTAPSAPSSRSSVLMPYSKFKTFSPQECANYFRHAGYVPIQMVGLSRSARRCATRSA